MTFQKGNQYGKLRKGHIKKLDELKKQSETMKHKYALGEIKLNTGCFKKGEHRSLTTEFKKGSIPWSKSQKGIHLSPATEFKKGNIPYSKLHPEVMLRGEKNPAFNNWSSREPYGKEFSPELKEQIRTRDNHRCQECFREQEELRTKTNKPYKLIVHHIDYDKKNCNPNNLISLCMNCHSQTQFNRDDWKNYFQDKI